MLSWALTQDDTQSLVAAMVSGVQKVELFNVKLDMELLTQYDGKGKCDSIKFFRKKETKWRMKFKTQMKAWAERIGWKYAEVEEHYEMEISREAAPKKEERT